MVVDIAEIIAVAVAVAVAPPPPPLPATTMVILVIIFKKATAPLATIVDTVIPETMDHVQMGTVVVIVRCKWYAVHF